MAAGRQPGPGRKRPSRPRRGPGCGACPLPWRTLADLGVVELGTDDRRGRADRRPCPRARKCGGCTGTCARPGLARARARQWRPRRSRRPAHHGWPVATRKTARRRSLPGWRARGPRRRRRGKLINAARRRYTRPARRRLRGTRPDRWTKPCRRWQAALGGSGAAGRTAAVWLHEHGERSRNSGQEERGLAARGPRGGGCLRRADPRDVVVELLPDLPPKAQADMVAGLWEVDHPGS